MVGWVSVLFRVVSRLDWRSCGSGTRKKKKIVVATSEMKKSYSGFNASALVVLGKRPVNAWSSFSGLHALLIYSSLNFMHLRSLCQQQCFFLIVFLLLGEPVHSMKCAVSKIDDAFFGTHNVVFFYILQQPHTNLTLDQLQQQLLIHSAFEHLNIFSLPASIMYFMMYVYTLHFTYRLLQKRKHFRVPRYLIHVPFFVA